jgi:hypothetical protein
MSIPPPPSPDAVLAAVEDYLAKLADYYAVVQSGTGRGRDPQPHLQSARIELDSLENSIANAHQYIAIAHTNFRERIAALKKA